MERLAGRRELAPDEVGELIDRIDAERPGRALVTGLTMLPAADRAVVERVDLAGPPTSISSENLVGQNGGSSRWACGQTRGQRRTAPLVLVRLAEVSFRVS